MVITMRTTTFNLHTAGLWQSAPEGISLDSACAKVDFIVSIEQKEGRDFIQKPYNIKT